jgi:hypothetical protein
MSSELDPVTRQKVVEWLNSHCPNMRCPMCGKQDWSGAMLAASVGVKTPVRGKIPFPTPPQDFQTLPLLYVFCQGCAHAVAFYAPDMGILNP